MSTQGWTTARRSYVDLEPSCLPRLKAMGYQFVELKYDGNFGEIISNPRGYWKLYSRHGLVKLQGDGCPPNIHVLGEYLIGTQWAKRSPDFKRFKLFEVRQWGASRAGVGWNAKSIAAAVGSLRKKDLDWVDPVKLYPIEAVMTLWNNHVLKGERFEGLVALKANGSLARIKRRVTMDYVLMDVLSSDSATYRGLAKSLVGGLYKNGRLVKVAKVSGMTAAQRKDLWVNRHKYIGRVFEASGRVIFESGALRHPSFERFRTDKKPRECVWPV